MRHVVPNPIGRPPKRQFTKISGSQNNSVVQVCQSEEMRGAFACLNIFESDIEKLFSIGKWMLYVTEHLHAGWLDVDKLTFDFQRFHQALRIFQRMVAGGES